MNISTFNRLKALEDVSRIDLPPVLAFGQNMKPEKAPPSLWNRGITPQDAEAINANTAHLLELLEDPDK